MKQPQAEYVGLRQILARRERCNNAGQQFVEDPGVRNNGRSSERLVEKIDGEVEAIRGRIVGITNRPPI